MMPNRLNHSGFLAMGDNLKQILERDDAAVKARGYSHQSIANFFQSIIKEIEKTKKPYVIRNDRIIKAQIYNTRGETHRSPFADNFEWSREISLIDLSSGRAIQGFSDGHPFLIGNYGFYQGNTSYRQSPDFLIDFMEGK